MPWTNIKTLMYINDPLKRDFYIEMCRLGHWSSRTLKERINSMLYERTAISKKPDETIQKELALLEKEDKLTQDLVFRDPYILKNLGLKDTYSEKDLESAILRELEDFIVEFGSDFAFMARQKRITIDNEDYYIDLLFYHRRLKCLVAIDLKLGKFEAGFKGQMELYLRWLEKYGLKIHTTYIAEMKRFYGIDMQCVRHTEETMNRSAHPTKEKKKAIIDAFQHFNLITQDQIME